MSLVFLLVVSSVMIFIGLYLGTLGRKVLDEQNEKRLITEGMDRVIAATSVVFVEHPDLYDRDSFFEHLDEVANNHEKRLQILALIQFARNKRETE